MFLPTGSHCNQQFPWNCPSFCSRNEFAKHFGWEMMSLSIQTKDHLYSCEVLQTMTCGHQVFTGAGSFTSRPWHLWFSGKLESGHDLGRVAAVQTFGETQKETNLLIQSFFEQSFWCCMNRNNRLAIEYSNRLLFCLSDIVGSFTVSARSSRNESSN